MESTQKLEDSFPNGWTPERLARRILTDEDDRKAFVQDSQVQAFFLELGSAQ